MAGLKLSNIQKTYENGFKAIHGIDLDIDDGAFVVLVGPSGCGKSTLLRMVAGLERITDGALTIGDRRVNELEPKDRDIAMVFQNYALYPHMSVFDNMAYGLKIAKRPVAEIKQRVDKAARMLELDALLDRRPRQLSGGQRQRVAMGRAIVREPSVFLFDEPLSNLDAKLRVQMRLGIKRLQRELGVTAIYVTHDQVEAMTLADRLVVMNAGSAEQIGAPMQIYARPETTFVAQFIGSPAMNLFDGKVAKTGKAIACPDGVELPVSGAEPTAGRPAIVGVRPEHFDVVRKDKTAFGLKVEVTEPLGADTLVHCSLKGHAGEIVVRMDGAADAPTEGELHVRPQQGAVHLFDPESGKRIN